MLAALVGSLVAGCRGAPTLRARTVMAARGATVHSNVTRADYAGSRVCAGCHAGVTSAWLHSPMHRMTRSTPGAEVRAPFDGTRWAFKDDAVILEQRDAERFVRIESASAGAPRTYRVTRVIGGRTREDFAGVDVAAGGDEVVLPVSFVFATRAFRYKGYSVMVHERSTLRAGPVWSRTCIFCHNTVPEMDRLLGAVAGPRAPGYQGEAVDPWLSPERRAHLRIEDADGFARAAGDEMTRLGGTPPAAADARQVARAAIGVVRSGFDGGALVEEGIGCEACHGGSIEHATDPRVHPTFVPTAPWLDAGFPSAAPGPTIDRVCARCHQVLFSRYPYTWEGGRRDSNAGGSHINSGEGRDFLLGGCASALACTACHDPHGGDDPGALRVMGTPAGNTLCTSCHGELADRERLRRHAHHDPSGAGGACIACHMPRKNMGLEGLTRYHRIGSPTDPARVLGDRPLECALCHASASVRHLVDAMEAWWPERYPRQRLTELYGSLDANVMRATLDRGKAHEQAVAMATLADANARDAAPLIARQLVNEYPLVREWARRALEKLGVTADLPPAAAASPSDEEPED
jgi:predicted CXXCH cytochrome family protein